MNVNILLFDDFEMLDAFGPAQIFGMAPEHFHLNYLSVKGGIINSSNGIKVWTEILIPEEVEDILVIPGGKGARKLLCLEQDSLRNIRKSAEMADYCLMVGNGSAVLAQTGLLFHRKVADYSYDANWKRMYAAGMTHVPGVKWMADGKYYSSSNTVSSMDMSLSVIADIVDITVAERAAEKMGYSWDAQSDEGIFL